MDSILKKVPVGWQAEPYEVARALSAKVEAGFASGANGGREATKVRPNNNLEPVRRSRFY